MMNTSWGSRAWTRHAQSVRNPLAARPIERIGAALVACLVSGCAWDEDLIIHNLQGTVRIPVEAATRDVLLERADGDTEIVPVTDVRLIGPVYLGLFPSVLEANVAASYPHPEIGPQYKADTQGDTYPYGGTTVGDFRYGCLEFLTCKLVSGRYTSYDDLIQWFEEIVQQPITGANAVPLENGEELRQTCFDLMEVTSDEEVRILAPDRDGDEKITEQDLDFHLNDNGDFFEADFTFWQQEWFWDQEQEGCEPGVDCTGPTLWGFHDTPSDTSYQYSTCNADAGYNEQTYNSDFFGGAPFPNLLNLPSSYLVDGDWVASRGYVWKDIYDRPVIDLDWQIGVTTEPPPQAE